MASNPDFFAHGDAFFGREPDVAYLLQRVETPGVTFVVARPKMGKTWLLLQVAQRLSESGPDSGGPAFLVGYHECKGGEELFRYTVQDLYTHWLGRAPLREQALQVWNQQKDGWVSMAAGTVAAIFSGVGKLTGIVPDAVGDVVSGAIDTLVSANKSLKSGDLDLPSLPYDQGRDLVSALAKISGRRTVMIFDAWEKAGDTAREQDFLDTYLKHREDWPHVHFIVGIRNPSLTGKADDPAWTAAQDLEKSSAAADIRQLAPLHLEDAAERARLLAHLRQRLPAASAVPDESLLSILNDYPGTLERWMEKPGLSTAAELKAEADDAEGFLYRELDRLLPSLNPDQLTLALRLALIPRASADTWQVYEPVVMEGIEDEVRLECSESGLLEGDDVPTYGHDTRHRAVALWFTGKAKYRPRVLKEAGRLIVEFAPRIDFIASASIPLTAGIRTVFRTVGPAGLPPLAQAIGAANLAFWNENPGPAILAVQPWPGTPEQRRQLAPFLGRSFYNIIIDARDAKDLGQATAVLDFLRRLHLDFPDLVVVRQRFAMMLVDVTNMFRAAGKTADSDSLMAELKALHQASAPETGVWREYGYSLYNAAHDAQFRKSFEEAVKWVDECRALQPNPPDAWSLREWSKMLSGLFEQGERGGQKAEVLNGWLEEIRGLAAAHPAEPSLRARLAFALNARGIVARERQQFEVSDLMLAQLLLLYGKFQGEEAIAEQLTSMLSVEAFSTPAAFVLSDRRPLLAMIRELSRRFPNNRRMGEYKAIALRTIEQKLRAAGVDKVPNLEQSLADLHLLLGQDVQPEGAPPAADPKPA
jgi:hypothetical protein